MKVRTLCQLLSQMSRMLCPFSWCRGYPVACCGHAFTRAYAPLYSAPCHAHAVPTPVLHYCQAREIAKTTKQALLSGQYEFVRCNFANPGARLSLCAQQAAIFVVAEPTCVGQTSCMPAAGQLVQCMHMQNA